jgi:hypothetical protein
MSLADDLQVIALRDVLVGDSEYRLRFLCRWYSKTFSTPLRLVSAIPLSEILTAFWEERYEKLEPHELEEERQLLTETEDDRRARLSREDAQAAADDMLLADLEAETARRSKAPLRIEDVKPGAPVKTKTRIAEPELPSLPDKLPENVSIKFASTDFFDELINKADDPQSSR